MEDAAMSGMSVLRLTGFNSIGGVLKEVPEE